MLKRFELKDFIHFAYQMVIAFALAILLGCILNAGALLVGYGLDAKIELNTFNNFITLFLVAFIYVLNYHPLHKPVQEELQDPEFLSLPEEVTQVYLLAELLSGPICHVNSAARGSINGYLRTFLEDDSLFEDLPTPDTLSLLRNVLKAGHLNSENQYLANNRLVNLMKELKRINNVPESNGV